MVKNPCYVSCLILFLSAVSVPSELAVVNAVPSESDAVRKLDLDPHLVGWWRFDETSGRTAADSSGHGRSGTLKGNLSFDKCSVRGQAGSALKFASGQDCVEITGYRGVTGTWPRTLTAWIKTTAPEGEIVSWGSDEYGKLWTFGFIRGRVGVTPKGGYLYMNAETHDDTWHHLAVVVEETELPNLHDHVRLYKDGAPAEIHDIGLLDLWPIETGSDFDVRIGRGFRRGH